jgi:hypothetical protein
LEASGVGLEASGLELFSLFLGSSQLSGEAGILRLKIL